MLRPTQSGSSGRRDPSAFAHPCEPSQMTNQPHRLDPSPDGEPSEESEDRPSLGDWLMESLRPPPPPALDEPDALESMEGSLSALASHDSLEALVATGEDIGAGEPAEEPAPDAVATEVQFGDSLAGRQEEASPSADAG